MRTPSTPNPRRFAMATEAQWRAAVAMAYESASCFHAPAKALLFFEAQDVSDDVVPLIGLKNEVRHGAMGSLEENI